MSAANCVLVVDDDRTDVFLLRRGFHRAGLKANLLDLPDGVAAREYLRGNPPYDDRVRFPLPKLLVLDIKMPRMNGFDVLAWISGRPDLTYLPSLILTSSPLQSDREAAARLGAREFLVKPNDPADWITLAQGLHERWLKAEPACAAVAFPGIIDKVADIGPGMMTGEAAHPIGRPGPVSC